MTNLEVEVGAPGPGVRRLAVDPARRRRHHVSDRAAERRDGGRREDRPGVLAVSLHACARRARLLRREQSRRRDSRRHAVHGHARRAPGRDRREERPAALEHRGRRPEARLLDHAGAARRQGQGDRRRRRRRVRHPRLHRAPTTRRPARRSGASTRFPVRANPGTRRGERDAWKPGGASVWVTGSYDPALNLTYWGIGNPGPDWNPVSAPATTSTPTRSSRSMPTPAQLKWHFQFTPNDGYDYDSVQVPVLADITWQGHAGEGDAVGEPQRLLLRARSHDRQVPARQAVREGELGERPRRERPADPDAAAAGHADLSRQSGRHQLVPAVVQPAHRDCSTSPRGKTTRRSIAAKRRRITPGAELHRRRAWTEHAGAGRAERRHRPPQSDQQLDRRGRQRRRHGDRSADRQAEVEVHAVRRHRRRHADDGVRSAVHRRPRRLLPRARCANRQAAVEGEPRRPDRDGADHLSGGRQAVRVGDFGPHSRHVRAARLVAY